MQIVQKNTQLFGRFYNFLFIFIHNGIFLYHHLRRRPIYGKLPPITKI